MVIRILEFLLELKFRQK